MLCVGNIFTPAFVSSNALCCSHVPFGSSLGARRVSEKAEEEWSSS